MPTLRPWIRALFAATLLSQTVGCIKSPQTVVQYNSPIDVGEDAFLGARAFVMPGVTIGEGAVVGAASVVVKDVLPWTVVVGNPANPVGIRKFKD